MSKCLFCKQDNVGDNDNGFGECKSHGHTFCSSCMSKYVEFQFVQKKKSFLLIQCPVVMKVKTKIGTMDSQCESILSFDEFQKHATDKCKELLKTVQKTIPDKATKLSDFGYYYDKEGKLRNKETGWEKFFKVNSTETGGDFHFVSQTHYEALGDLIVREIQDMMVKDFNMLEIQTPQGEKYKDSPKNNIFMTKDALTCDTLFLIVQGSGAVRAGQWARALCINEGLKTGSILNYLKDAKQEKWGVIVFNPNLNKVPKKVDPLRFTKQGFMQPKPMKPLDNDQYEYIPLNESPVKHVVHVWDEFASKAKAKDIIIVAHSAGGHGTMELLRRRGDEVLKRLRGVAFTDSVHDIEKRDTDELKEWVMENTINWITSDKPLGTKVKVSQVQGCLCLSAGHTVHENTSESARVDVFKFLKGKLDEAAKKRGEEQ